MKTWEQRINGNEEPASVTRSYPKRGLVDGPVDDDKLNAFERAARNKPAKSDSARDMSPSERMKAARTTGEEETRTKWSNSEKRGQSQ
jgi:hypothetical protein